MAESIASDNATGGGINSIGDNSMINSITRGRQRIIRPSTKTKKCIGGTDCIIRLVFQIP